MVYGENAAEQGRGGRDQTEGGGMKNHPKSIPLQCSPSPLVLSQNELSVTLLQCIHPGLYVHVQVSPQDPEHRVGNVAIPAHSSLNRD